MLTLLTLPVELIHTIFNGLDQFDDLISLASTCRYINRAWLSGAPDFIWRVGVANIIAFDEALVAVSIIATTPVTPLPMLIIYPGQSNSGCHRRPKLSNSASFSVSLSLGYEWRSETPSFGRGEDLVRLSPSNPLH